MKKIFLLFFVQASFFLFGNSEQQAVEEYIDVIIPAHAKDVIALEYCIAGIKKNCQNIRRIIVISRECYTENAEWVSEACFPFTIKDISNKLSVTNPPSIHSRMWTNKIQPRSGWYLQQLLKLYAPFVIENISNNILVVDSDLIFLKPVNFLNQNGAGLYCISLIENHAPYFAHAQRLLGEDFIRVDSAISAITHHMLFQKKVIESIFDTVEALHKKPFWEAFCELVDRRSIICGASEYEIYFNYVLSHPFHAEIRRLKWANVREINPEIISYCEKNYDFICWQSYLR